MLKHEGKFVFTVKDVNTGIIEHQECINTIMNDCLDELTKPLLGLSTNYQIKYLAVGTSSASVYVTQSSLVNEFFRTPVASQTKSGTGQVKTYFYILSTEATTSVIREVAAFCGTTASTTSNSGRMMSRILWTYDKTSGDKEVQIERIDTIQKI
jgi:hypothetical protein